MMFLILQYLLIISKPHPKFLLGSCICGVVVYVSAKVGHGSRAERCLLEDNRTPSTSADVLWDHFFCAIAGWGGASATGGGGLGRGAKGRGQREKFAALLFVGFED